MDFSSDKLLVDQRLKKLRDDRMRDSNAVSRSVAEQYSETTNEPQSSKKPLKKSQMNYKQDAEWKKRSHEKGGRSSRPTSRSSTTYSSSTRSHSSASHISHSPTRSHSSRSSSFTRSQSSSTSFSSPANPERTKHVKPSPAKNSNEGRYSSRHSPVEPLRRPPLGTTNRDRLSGHTVVNSQQQHHHLAQPSQRYAPANSRGSQRSLRRNDCNHFGNEKRRETLRNHSDVGSQPFSSAFRHRRSPHRIQVEHDYRHKAYSRDTDHENARRQEYNKAETHVQQQYSRRSWRSSGIRTSSAAKHTRVPSDPSVHRVGHGYSDSRQAHQKSAVMSYSRAGYLQHDERESNPHGVKQRKRQASPNHHRLEESPPKRARRQESVHETRYSINEEDHKRASSYHSRRHHEETEPKVFSIEEKTKPLKPSHNKAEAHGHTSDWGLHASDSASKVLSQSESDDLKIEAAGLTLSLGASEQVEEELDYDENMDNLDLHVYPTEELDINVKGSNNNETKSSVCPASVPLEEINSPDGMKSCKEAAIKSPIRVSPEHHHRLRNKDSERLPVKERLYLSKSAIQRKKEQRMVQYRDESKHQLRPSLASRLGPAPSRRGSRHEETRLGPGSRENTLKESAAITEEYKQKKRQADVRQEDIQRARQITKSLNERDGKAPWRHTAEGNGAQPLEKEKILDEVIDKIKEKNKSIVKRKKEIEVDVERYG